MNLDVIRAVIFDMDGVLCDLDELARLTELSRITGCAPKAIRAKIWESGFESLSDCGQLTANEYLNGFGARLGYPISTQEWALGRRAGTIPDQVGLEFARKLKATRKIALLTNNGLQLKKSIHEVFPELPELFGEDLFVSAEFTLAKPEPQIYLEVCKRIGSRPEQTLMIDDKLENIEGALAAGLQGLHFTSWNDANCSIGRLLDC